MIAKAYPTPLLTVDYIDENDTTAVNVPSLFPISLQSLVIV